ncbi:hypothetical protein BJ875DRAFT_488118 [Amylocarpus encephaloides]|uniref:Uncharacterized protein n=1 Tax=Amylocarpus encephaloides TaxID=45428 RepID=A0A9P8C2T9_9HELO|nr:hypothetical protein BJ875DRAFT_488118 [Amylocarpus encephaloides]
MTSSSDTLFRREFTSSKNGIVAPFTGFIVPASFSTEAPRKLTNFTIFGNLPIELRLFCLAYTRAAGFEDLQRITRYRDTKIPTLLWVSNMSLDTLSLQSPNMEYEAIEILFSIMVDVSENTRLQYLAMPLWQLLVWKHYGPNTCVTCLSSLPALQEFLLSLDLGGLTVGYSTSTARCAELIPDLLQCHLSDREQISLNPWIKQYENQNIDEFEVWDTPKCKKIFRWDKCRC